MRARRQPDADLETIMPLLIGQWRRAMQLAGPGDRLQTREFRSAVAQIQQLQRGLWEGKELVGRDYFSHKETLGAYTLYHWPVHYQQALTLINEIPDIPHRVLDVGAGPCPFAFGALRHGAHEVFALDASRQALEWGAQICGRYGLPLSLLPGKLNDVIKQLAASFDLIIAAHCLDEIFASGEEAIAGLEKLLALLVPTGHLLLVGASAPADNMKMLALRDSLVEKGYPIRAPCVWQGGCPARRRPDSPCFAQRPFEKPPLLAEIQRAASINLSSLKMSYLIVGAKGAPWPANPRPATQGLPLYRVISPPFDGHFGTTFYLCGVDGKKKLASSLTALPAAARPFQYLKRGELIAVKDAVEHGNTLEVREGTAIDVVAPCGKAWT